MKAKRLYEMGGDVTANYFTNTGSSMMGSSNSSSIGKRRKKKKKGKVTFGTGQAPPKFKQCRGGFCS